MAFLFLSQTVLHCSEPWTVYAGPVESMFEYLLFKGFDKIIIMNEKEILGGVAHNLPSDFKKAILLNDKVLALWNDITPLARNEWICWITSGKKMETRSIRISKAISKLKSGMRRPCCWSGCTHR